MATNMFEAVTARVLIARERTFHAFLAWLHEEGRNDLVKEYSALRNQWLEKADGNGVVEIPVKDITMVLLRALTCMDPNSCMDAEEDIRDGEVGLFLGGHVFVPRPATRVAVALGSNWGHFTSKRFLEGGAFFTLKATKEEEFFQNPNLPVGVWALIIEGLYIEKKAVDGNKNILRELTDRGRALKVGFLVTTHQKGSKQWLKVAAMVPLSMQNLEAVKDIAADLLETFPWLRLDASINVSVRRADRNGCVQKEHTGGQQAVAALEGGSKFAKNFLDPKTQKAGSWRFPVSVLPEAPSILDKEALSEFEDVVVERNESEVEDQQTTPVPLEEQMESVVSLPEGLRMSWADDDDEDDLVMDYSVLPVMPSLPSRQEPTTSSNEELEPVTPVAPKKKNRRGTRGKGRAC